eukprot:9491239-Pyramimonas_sp.AAC.2
MVTTSAPGVNVTVSPDKLSTGSVVPGWTPASISTDGPVALCKTERSASPPDGSTYPLRVQFASAYRNENRIAVRSSEYPIPEGFGRVIFEPEPEEVARNVPGNTSCAVSLYVTRTSYSRSLESDTSSKSSNDTMNPPRSSVSSVETVTARANDTLSVSVNSSRSVGPPAPDPPAYVFRTYRRGDCVA